METTDKKETVTQEENVTIAYKGNVTIQKIDSVTGKVGKKIQRHNEGKVPLFELIAQSIAQVNVTASMPKYLKGFNQAGASTFSSYISYNNPIVSTGVSSASVQFDFLVPFTQLSTEKTLYLRLFNSTEASPTVFAQVDVSTLNLVGDGKTNYLVTWIITIGNVPTV